jgi:hypothetical protein
MQRELRQSLVTFFVILLLCAIGIVYAKTGIAPYPFLRVWEWTNIALLAVAVPFIFLQKKAGLPEFWDQNVSMRNRLLYPGLIGIAFGLLDVLVIKGILHPEPYTELPPFLQPFPYSIFLFFSGALEVEVFYRLIPFVLVLLLFSKIKGGKYLDLAFWVTAILTALREPLEQFPTGAVWFVAYAFISGFLMNLIQAIFLRKSGFIGSLSVRLGHYLIWHILLGIYVEWVELA